MIATGAGKAPVPSSGRRLERERLLDRLAAPLLMAFGFWLMFRPVLEEGFRRSLGDNGDSIILLATLEHWSKVLHGDPVGGSWRDEGFFYPTPGTLGLTDSYFLYALPYVAFRALSIGPFAAFTAVIATYSIAGYWSMYALCRLWPRAAPVPAAVAAFIFACGAMVRFKLAHAQTYTVMLVPLLTLLLLAAFRALRPGSRILAGAAAGLLLGLILFSAVQTVWFLGFVAMAILACRAVMGQSAAYFSRSWLVPAAGFAAGLAIGLVPAVVLYLPGLQQGHQRSFDEAIYFLPRATDLLQVPPGTLVWFGLLKFVGLADMPMRPLSEVALGYTPVFLLAAAILAWRLPASDSWNRIAKACVGGALLVWILQIDYFGFVPWRLIFDFVPGASLIRTPFRSQIVCLFFMCLAFAHVVTALARRSTGRTVAGLILALCVIEQVGPPPFMRKTDEIASWLSKSARPDFPCEAFFVVPMPGSTVPWFEQQADAMILSEKVKMPTLNGNSSFIPAGWHMRDPSAPEYPGAVRDWIDANRLQGRVCGVDPRAGRWTEGVSSLEASAEGDSSSSKASDSQMP